MKLRGISAFVLAGTMLAGVSSAALAQESIKDKTVDTTKKAGKATKKAATKTANYTEDRYVTTAIHSKFVDEDTLKGSKIDVDTKNHVVTLNGTVLSEAGKARAEEIARTTKGVDRVVNNLTIGAKRN
jgi:osmotically-inducible protein OsmY